MQCPKCAATIEPAPAPAGKAALAILGDWRVWAAAFLVMAACGLAQGALGLGSRWNFGAGGGAAIGLLVALRLGRMRTCPQCGKVFAIDPTPPAVA